MIRYKSPSQMSIEEFKTPLQAKLDKENRWVILSGVIPWDKLASIYYKRMNKDQGAPTIDARVVIGAMIIKHKLNLDDRETIQTIRENMYIQYFLGLSEYTYQPVFDPSLFVTLRKRIGVEEFDRMTCEIINSAEPKHNDKEDEDNTPITSAGNNLEQNNESIGNSGKLIVDATVADQMIVYPTDVGLVSRSREESERIIDVLCKHLNFKSKPRTYRRNARKQYLSIAKKKHKTNAEIRKGLGKQLRFLRRNLKSIDKLLDKVPDNRIPMDKRDLKIYHVIQHIFDQQQTMYQTRTHSIPNRIVNIYQPHVRPIVRGKDKVQVEFGSKIGVSLQNGYARVNTLTWEARNEGGDLEKQVEDYKAQNGFYPKVVIADKIYGTHENRNMLKKRGIRFSGKPLGRPSMIVPTAYQKRKQKIENGIRNHIEGKFGQGKNAYGLNKVRARLIRTSESWVACIIFVLNLVKLGQVFLSNFSNLIYERIFQVSINFWSRKMDIKPILSFDFFSKP